MMPTPKRAEQGWPPVVVCSVFQTGLNLMRDLERRGVLAIGVDCAPDNAGFRSRYGKSYLCPNPDLAPAEWVAFMRSLATRLGAKPVIMAAADAFVEAIGRHADELAPAFTFSRESVATQARLSTKEEQYRLAASAGFPCPRTCTVESGEDLARFASGARFPCLLKPQSHREWEELPADNPFHGKKVATAQTAGELRAHYDRVAAVRPRAIVQEVVAGGDDAKYCYLAVYGTEGERLGYLVVHELRCYPIRVGSASVVEPVVDEEIAGMCDRFLRQIHYAGLCEIEVKRDARDGRVMLIEVNPRFSGTFDCAIYAGLDAGWLHYLDLIGQAPAPAEANRFDFRHITVMRDAPAFPQYLQAGLTGWGQWWSAYRRPVEFYDVDFRDWGVTRRTFERAFRNLAGGLLRNWRQRSPSAPAPG
jgi:predicted ATP-grasp superfamily ATP-dependent carboligase